MHRLPVVLVHGYSDVGTSFGRWRQILESAGYHATAIHLGSYVSLSNEITIKDIAEGFDRALHERAGLGTEQPFDAIVHSTGMLVVREWLTAYAERRERLKHLIGLAPATFGSPMAHKGRSWLGAIFKGGKEAGPDFLEAGDQVLAGLELGSQYTWNLAHRDFLAADVAYGPTSRTPYPFIFMGLKDYGWIKRAITEPGTDGTVRWAGAGFNVRKVIVDLTIDPSRPGGRQRVQIHPWRNTIIPLVFLADANHGTIMSDPGGDLQKMVREALDVSSGPEYEAWRRRYEKASAAALKARGAARWQQFVIHAVDERSDGVPDYFIRVGRVTNGRFTEIPFDLDVHAYRDDQSYRCFHVNLDKIGDRMPPAVALQVIAASGTELVAYHGYGSEAWMRSQRPDSKEWDAVIQFDSTIGRKEVAFFWPYTTTLIELRLNREPMPLQGNRVFWFLKEGAVVPG